MAIAIGVANGDGSVILNPSVDFPLQADTGIIVIAEDDDSYEAVRNPFDVSISHLHLSHLPFLSHFSPAL